MSLSRRALLATASATVLGIPLAACGSDNDSGGGGGGGNSVDIGYIADFNGASLLAIADERGLWKKHGLSPSTKVFTNGPLQIQALKAGDLDVGYIGPGAMWLPASGQAKIIAVNTLTYADRVIAKPGISRASDLAGKKVGVPEGTSGEMVLNLALDDADMSMDDIEKVPMDPSTVVSAFSSGQIDAAGIWYPLIDTIKKRVPDLVEVAATEDFPDYSFPTAFVAGNDVDEELTRKVIAVLQEANDWRKTHTDEAIALTAGMLKLDEDTVKADAAHVRTMPTAELVDKTEDGTVTDWLSGLNELFTDAGKLKSAPDPTTYYTGDLYTKASAK